MCAYVGIILSDPAFSLHHGIAYSRVDMPGWQSLKIEVLIGKALMQIAPLDARYNRVFKLWTCTQTRNRPMEMINPQ